MLLYSDRPGLRGEGDARAVQLLLRRQSTATPGDVVSLHSDQSAVCGYHSVYDTT